MAVADDQDDAVALGRIGHGAAFLERERHRFLDDRMFAVGRRREQVGRVVLMRGGDVDRIDVRRGAQLLGARVRAAAEVALEAFPGGGIGVGAGGQAHVRVRQQAREHRSGRSAEPDCAEP